MKPGIPADPTIAERIIMAHFEYAFQRIVDNNDAARGECQRQMAKYRPRRNHDRGED